jgi:hypothetical protein
MLMTTHDPSFLWWSAGPVLEDGRITDRPPPAHDPGGRRHAVERGGPAVKDACGREIRYLRSPSPIAAIFTAGIVCPGGRRSLCPLPLLTLDEILAVTGS